MRYDFEGIERLPARPRIKVSVIGGECWFVAQDVWEAIGATRSAIEGMPKAFIKRIPVEDKKATAINLAGLLYLLAGMGVQLSLPTENRALLMEHAPDGQRLEPGKDSLAAYGRETCIVLSGAAECISAVGQIRRDLSKRRAAKKAEKQAAISPSISLTEEPIPQGE